VANELDRFRTDVGAIVAKHEAKRGLTDFTRYAADPVGFLRDVLHCDPWAAQIKMAELVRDEPKVALVSANSIGKDWLIARLALWWTYAVRGFVIMTSVTDRQARNISMKQVRSAFLGAPALAGELFQMELRVDDDQSGIIAFTSDSADRLVGFHHPRLLLCLSEAQGLEPEVFEAAFACATGEENRICIYGNPTRPTGNFHAAATSDSWAPLTISALEHPNIISGREEIPGGPSLAWIQSMREEYGETSSIYRSRVLSEWPEESVEGLIKRVWLRAAFDRHDARQKPATFEDYLERSAEPAHVVLGVDVARYGADHSVAAIIRGPHVESLSTWHGASTTDSADRVLNIARSLTTRLARPRIVVDEPGLGGGLIDVLRKEGWDVIAFNGAAQAPEPARFLNLRAASHWKFRELLENNIISLPRDSTLEEEALAVEWQLAVGSGGIQIVAKDMIRKALGRSPDRLDAVVMGLWESIGNPYQGWVIRKLAPR
jgi:phage terminase large subunit